MQWTPPLDRNFELLQFSCLLFFLFFASARGFVDGFEISLCFSSVGAETCCCIVLDLLGCIIVL
jgi:hypothetical protein